MPRKPRLDAPGLLHHIIARGIDGRELFADSKDREFFIERLGEILLETETPIFAFAIVFNHFHLLLRREKTDIATVMRRLLTGYALHYNRAHKRFGHLFQNRYKGIICQDEPYFLELIRYIHLNPIRAGLLTSATSLNNYPFSGHSYIMGKQKSQWFKPDLVLSRFAPTKKRAMVAYHSFLIDGLSMGKRPDLTGGGLKRSLGYSKNFPKEVQASDERILGEGNFVESVLTTCEDRPVRDQPCDIDSLVSSACEELGVSEASILGSARTRPVTNARAYLAYQMSTELGLSPTQIASVLSISVPGTLKAIDRWISIRGNS